MSNNPLSHLSGSSIELLVSCVGLADLDEFTKSDPMCVLFYKQFGQWKEFGRTEAIRNSLNPKVGYLFYCLSHFLVFDFSKNSNHMKLT